LEGSLRRLYICGEIDSDNYQIFSEGLAELEAESDEGVLVELNSEGGTAFDGLAFADRIRISPCPITIRVMGQAASAAVIILASGDKRAMAENSWVFVHEDSLSEVSGSISQIEKQGREGRRFETQWSDLLAKLTTSSSTTWDKLHKAETYLNPNECLELGLIDEIV